jgi:Spy/CpxP family protein refolding chaperone
MFRNRIAVSTLLALLLTVSLAFAQQTPAAPPDPAPHIQHHVAMLTKMLGLTTEQQQNATTIFTNAHGNEANFHDSMKNAHDSLNTAVKSNDANAITQAAATIGNLTAQMVAQHAKAEAAFYQILTPDQQAKFNEFASSHHGMHGGFGPGMHP